MLFNYVVANFTIHFTNPLPLGPRSFPITKGGESFAVALGRTQTNTPPKRKELRGEHSPSRALLQLE